MTALVAAIVANVVVSLLGFRVLRDREGRDAEAYLFIPYQVARGENGVGLLLAHFAHAGFAHLAFNMLALYSFGGTVLTALGPMRFLLIYAVAGLGADLVVLAPTTSIMAFLVPVPIPGPLFMLGYTVIALFLIAQKRRGGISHEGHLGGALVGLTLTGILAPRGLQPLIRWFAQWSS